MNRNFLALSFLLCFAALAGRAETLHYSINWASGLSLGEGTLTATDLSGNPEGRGAGWRFSLMVDASVPGYAVRDEYESRADSGLCSISLDKTVSRGSTKSGEKVLFDQGSRRATRESKIGGGEHDFSVPECAKDALTYLAFVRQELAQGRLAPKQPAILGGAYEVELVYLGSEMIRVGERRVEADKVQARIKGPASDHTVEILFDRDAIRTPLLARLQLPLGTFTVELLP